jgi:precorrin-8X/cobalt-precorrin-8 methylmutase
MFDRYIVVDWSANSTPKLGRDSIWIGVRDRTGQVSTTNHATRRSAEARLVELLEEDAVATTLLGVDFSLGYPAGTAAALGLGGVPWSAMWATIAEGIRDDDRNGNNRFTVAAGFNDRMTGSPAPFWGCPPSAAGTCLATTKPRGVEALPEFRVVEATLRNDGHRPFSSWQLLGAGAVGSQSLVGIPVLERLRTRFGDRLDVWPFTTGFRLPPSARGSIVVAEVWPSMIEVVVTGEETRDAAQVAATATWLATAAAASELGAMFSPRISQETAAVAGAEEGWVLGVSA